MTWFALKPLALAAWRVLTIMIPIPLALIVAAGLWVHFDKASAVRKAVNKAVSELVAGAEIDALEAKLAAERDLRVFAEGRASALADANRHFEEQRIATERENEGLSDEIEQLKAGAVPDGVDQPLFDRMHNK
ncbi:hypothetical protein J1C56_02175 [Aminobacter anthyllidis]|uniref:Uncharacterized protein n=1 Tax=Aminobacter anthyllidis TaxID=1035067 RepID=A0A9X1A6Y9_9HYPH|nr:hypothetical protein [Aminobacter anthyllidis]MBT1154392.1 hypothetical protein [Aminobacter anthyllidis]